MGASFCKIIAGPHLMFQWAIKNEQKKSLKNQSHDRKSAFLTHKLGTLSKVVEQKTQPIKMARQT